MYGLDSSSMSLLGFGAIVIIAAFVMYLVSLVSMKETRFEDVLEEQRKKKAKEDKERTQANKQKREQYKKKLNLKKKKTATVDNGKLEKDDSSTSTSLMYEEQIKETPQMETVELAVAPDLKKPPVVAPEPKKPKAKAAKKQPQEPPVQPKEESPKPSRPVLKPAPEKPKQETPVVSTSQTATDAKEEAEKKQDTGRIRTVSFSDEVQEKQKYEAEQEKVKKKKKKEMEVESETVGLLREVSLSDRDVQNILTLIKQKYNIDVGGGAKIKDLQHQLDSAKKQLAQSEDNLQQYVARCMSAENKIEQLKQDLMVEKVKVASLEKAVQDADNKRKQEVAAVQSHQAAEIKQLQDRVAVAGDYEEVCKAVESLNIERTYLVAEISKNAAVVAEKNRLSGDLQQLTQKFQEAQRRCVELETHQQQEGEKEKHYIHQLNERANAFQQMQQGYSNVDSELKKVVSELQATQSNSTKLLEQVTALQEDNEAKAEVQRELEQRLAASNQLLRERDTQIKDVTKQNADSMSQVQNLGRQITQLNSQIIKVEKDTKDKAASDSRSAKDAERINVLQDELESVKKEKTILKEDVDRLKKKNNDLRDRSWKAMDTLSNLEKALPEKVAAAKADGDVRCARLETSVKQSLKDAFPDISIGEENFEAWVKVFASKASEAPEIVQSTVESSEELEEARVEIKKLRHELESNTDETSGLKSRISELETSVKKIQKEKESLQKDSRQKEEEVLSAVAEFEKYKKVLNSTEEVLGNLQSSVEVEEGVWRKKVDDAHKEASKAQQDAEDLRRTIEKLESEKSFLQRNVKEAEELKKRFEEATNEVSELKVELENAKIGLTDGQQQIEDIICDGVGGDFDFPALQVDKQQQSEDTPTKTVSCQSDSPVQVEYSDACTETMVQQHQDVEGFLVIEQVDLRELNGKPALSNGYEDELAKLKERLDKEKTLTKNLGQAATKLQTVLKQTQEQLNEEREKSSDLEKKLTTDADDGKENSDNGLAQEKVDDDDGTCV